MSVESAGPYANNLHLAPDRLLHQHLITQYLQARCSFTEGINETRNVWHILSGNDFLTVGPLKDAVANCIFVGDVVYYDEKERFFVVDRIKELIKYKGFQVINCVLIISFSVFFFLIFSEWVGECFFWYWLTRVVSDKGPLNGCVLFLIFSLFFVI